jgi:DNA-binding XRE family transcriptional regulator
LLGVWNKLERSILEDAAPGQPSRQSSQSHVGNHFAQAPEQAPDAPYTFGKKVTRTSLWSAMQQSGMGVDDLARAVGVDKSTISRLLRDVQQGPGDPGGRNPSVGLAHKIAQVLGVDVGEVLPPPDDVKIHKRKATSGSGRQGTATNSTNGNSSFGQGGPAPAPSESLVRQAAALMVECKIEPTQFLVEQLIGLPNSDQLINEFLGKMFGKKSANSPAAAPQGSENTTVGTGKRTDGTSKFVSEASRSITEASLQLMELQSLFQKYPFTASFGGQKFTLDQWLGGIISSLRKVKHNLPEAVLKAKARQQPGGVDTKSTTTPA